MTLIATYAIRLMKFPACSIIKASLEKVEKVVNPPQMPTVKAIGKADFAQAGYNQDNPIHDVLNIPAEGCSTMPASPSKDTTKVRLLI